MDKLPIIIVCPASHTNITYSEVTLSDLETTLKELDPTKPSEDLHTLYSTAFSVPLEQVTSEEAKQLAISSTQLAERLQYCELTRTGVQ